MKNSVRILAAATALSAIVLPAQAGYTIYEDAALPSVLFVEFDGPAASSDEATGVPAARPVSLGAGGSVDVIEFDDVEGERSGDFATDGDDRAPEASDRDATPTDDDAGRDEFVERIDDALIIDNERVRDAVIDDIIADEFLNDVELR